uniref:Uncharacterized protein n=1 Tax=Cannabis sativa TaxID=3483 RepID=A0A803P3H4_CANSA
MSRFYRLRHRDVNKKALPKAFSVQASWIRAQLRHGLSNSESRRVGGPPMGLAIMVPPKYHEVSSIYKFCVAGHLVQPRVLVPVFPSSRGDG